MATRCGLPANNSTKPYGLGENRRFSDQVSFEALVQRTTSGRCWYVTRKIQPDIDPEVYAAATHARKSCNCKAPSGDLRGPTPLGYDIARLSPHPSTSGNFNAPKQSCHAFDVCAKSYTERSGRRRLRKHGKRTCNLLAPHLHVPVRGSGQLVALLFIDRMLLVRGGVQRAGKGPLDK